MDRVAGRSIRHSMTVLAMTVAAVALFAATAALRSRASHAVRTDAASSSKPNRALEIPATHEHVGSTVVMLRG